MAKRVYRKHKKASQIPVRVSDEVPVTFVADVIRIEKTKGMDWLVLNIPGGSNLVKAPVTLVTEVARSTVKPNELF